VSGGRHVFYSPRISRKRRFNAVMRSFILSERRVRAGFFVSASCLTGRGVGAWQ
jgi:hypothetical protein